MTDNGKRKFFTHKRRQIIADLVDGQGTVRVSDMSERFGVSPMTIRRDIDALERNHQVVRVHGGATKVERGARSVDEPGFQTKLRMQEQEKAGIAAAAARRIRPGSAVGITAGTTTYPLIEHLRDIANLTVVTNSIPIASSLSSLGTNGMQVVITGGSPTPSNAVVGPLADQSLAGLHLDMLFMGVHGMGETTGFTTPNLPEAQTNRAFIRSARQTIVLADSTKWGLTGLGTIAALAEADVLVTDSGLDQAAVRVLQRELEVLEVVDLS